MVVFRVECEACVERDNDGIVMERGFRIWGRLTKG